MIRFHNLWNIFHRISSTSYVIFFYIENRFRPKVRVRMPVSSRGRVFSTFGYVVGLPARSRFGEGRS